MSYHIVHVRIRIRYGTSSVHRPIGASVRGSGLPAFGASVRGSGCSAHPSAGLATNAARTDQIGSPCPRRYNLPRPLQHVPRQAYGSAALAAYRHNLQAQWQHMPYQGQNLLHKVNRLTKGRRTRCKSNKNKESALKSCLALRGLRHPQIFRDIFSENISGYIFPSGSTFVTVCFLYNL